MKHVSKDGIPKKREFVIPIKNTNKRIRATQYAINCEHYKQHAGQSDVTTSALIRVLFLIERLDSLLGFPYLQKNQKICECCYTDGYKNGKYGNTNNVAEVIVPVVQTRELFPFKADTVPSSPKENIPHKATKPGCHDHNCN
ncbi:unnamed protein product [Owenia fusiformis]|uniref:Uncharacterized protein n=1 Tax=Owenia fusiformis TaxID=6347 RepID=A0A8J1XZC0_OWEFU|nr:unnamed protein product [Owenia fusiformis]